MFNITGEINLNKKLMAKYAALKKTSDSLREDSKKSFGDDLKSKQLSKVTVMAKDEEGLKKGLSKAEELLRAKYGEKGLSEEDMEESEEVDCPACDNEGCDECFEEESESEE